jgi:protein CWC15
MPSHTKLKFRQVGQTSSSEVQKRDLKYELLLAEHEAKNKKRKAEGMPEIEFEYKQPAGAIESGNGEGEDTANKRRKILEEVGDLDKDDDDEDAPDVEDSKDKDKAMDSDEEDRFEL